MIFENPCQFGKVISISGIVIWCFFSNRFQRNTWKVCFYGTVKIVSRCTQYLLLAVVSSIRTLLYTFSQPTRPLACREYVLAFSVCFFTRYSNLKPSVLWRCWLGGRKGIRPVKNWVVRCWRGYLSGVRCRFAYGPADATATQCLLLQ